jgi:hypothetical protein
MGGSEGVAMRIGRHSVGLALLIGGATWAVLRPIIATTYSDPLHGLSYEDWNRLMVVPLVLLLIGSVALGGFAQRSPGRAGVLILVAGVAVSLAGVVIEFAIGGGLRGDRWLAMAGWALYGIGILGQAVGLVLLGIGALRGRRVAPAIVGLAMAALHLAWLPLVAAEQFDAAIADQVLIGVGSITLGVLFVRAGRGDMAATPTGARPP